MERPSREPILIDQEKPVELPLQGCHNCKLCVTTKGMGPEPYPQCRASPPQIGVFHSIQVTIGNPAPQLMAQAIALYPRVELSDPGCGHWQTRVTN